MNKDNVIKKAIELSIFSDPNYLMKFANHFYSLGRDAQRESDANVVLNGISYDEIANYACKLIKNNTGEL